MSSMEQKKIDQFFETARATEDHLNLICDPDVCYICQIAKLEEQALKPQAEELESDTLPK